MATDDAIGENAFRRAMNAAVRILAVRDHTRGELSRKLSRGGYGSAVIQRVLAECGRLRYIDDEAVARMVMRRLTEKGFGNRRVDMDLRKKGIDAALIEKLLSEEARESEELEAAERAVKTKSRRMAGESDPRKRTEKVYRFLISRGFSPSVASRAMRQVGAP